MSVKTTPPRAEPPRAGAKRRRKQPEVRRNWYGRAYDAAMSIEGLDHEEGVLRTKFKELAKQDKVERLFVHMSDALVRMVVANHRLSKQSKRKLNENTSRAIRAMAKQLFPERVDGA